MSETGADTTGILISIPDNSSTLTGKLPTEYKTVYLRVSTGDNFSTGYTEYAMIQSGTEWIWTGDLDDSMYFTFATRLPPAPG